MGHRIHTPTLKKSTHNSPLQLRKDPFPTGEIQQFEWNQSRAELEKLQSRTQPLRRKIQWIWEWVIEGSVVRKWIGKRGCKIEKENVEKRRIEFLWRFGKLKNGFGKKKREWKE